MLYVAVSGKLGGAIFSTPPPLKVNAHWTALLILSSYIHFDGVSEL